MANYHYKAVSASGDIVEGDMSAASSDFVVERLRKDGHYPLSVGESTVATVTPGRARTRRHGSRRGAPGPLKLGALASLARELATLIRAGVPLDRALEFSLELTAEEPLRRALEGVLARVRSGASLADAVRQAGDAFPPYFSGMLRAGEAGGNLHHVLDDLAAYLDRLHTFRESLRSALIYPIILAAMTVITLIVVFAGVLPKFRPFFEELGDDLPLLTRGFLVAGDFVEAWWWAGLLAVLAVVLVVRLRLRDSGFRYLWDRFKLALPITGNFIQRAESVRFARTLAMLLAGGVPVTEALRTVRDALSSTVFRKSVDDVINGLREGGSLAAGVASAGVFPRLAVQLVQVGEATARLDVVLTDLADTLEREAQRSTQRFLAILVPAVTIFLGGIIALVIISVLGAFLSVNDLAY